MYRECELVNLNDSSKTLKRNVSESNAVVGLGIKFSDVSGSWVIKRVHGYSLFSD